VAPAEELSLQQHISICDLRYQEVCHRLTILEEKVDKLHATIENFRSTVIDYTIRGFVGLVLLMAGAIFAIQV